MLRQKLAPQPSRGLGVPPAVSRSTVPKAASAATLPLRPQDFYGPASASPSCSRHHDDSIAERFQAPTVQFPDLHSMPGPATLVKSSGTDFIDYIVGMDAVEAEHRLRDAQTFRTLVLGVTTAAAGPSFHRGAPSAAAELLRPATPRRGALNLKQLTAFRDHVTRNLAPTVAHGFATAATAMRRGGSGTVGRREDTAASRKYSDAEQHHLAAAALFVGTANNIVPSESLLQALRPVRTVDSSLPPSSSSLRSWHRSEPAAEAAARAPAPLTADDATAKGTWASAPATTAADGPPAVAAGAPMAPAVAAAAAAELGRERASVSFLDSAPLFAALAFGGSSSTMLTLQPEDERGGVPENVAASAAAVRVASVSSSSTASAPLLQPPRHEAVAVGAAAELQRPTAATVIAGVAATSASAAATATAAPDRRGRRGSHRAVRVGDAGRRGAAGAAASGATGPSWL